MAGLQVGDVIDQVEARDIVRLLASAASRLAAA
jgi:hypothetical protein